MKLRIILMCIMLSLLMVPSAFALGGNVSGHVTDANSQPLAGISVQFYDTSGTTITKAGLTDSAGDYSVTSMTAGSYKVIFYGNNGSGAPYVQKWYNGASSLATATAITVTNGATTSGIGATMGGVASPKVDLGTATNGAAGAVVKIPVTITTGGAAISSVGVKITFDPNKFDSVSFRDPNDPTMTSATARGAAAIAASKDLSAENIVVSTDGTVATYTVGVLSQSNTNVIGDGVLLNLYCTLAASATSGPLTLANLADASDPSGSAITVAGTAGTISFPDLVKPVVDTFVVPATATSTIVNLTMTASDNIGVTGYLITESATAPLADDSGWSSTVLNKYIFGTEGAKTIYAWAKDAAGNVSLSKSASVTITLPDVAPPTVSAFTMPVTATTLVVDVSTFTATDTVGVTGYLITESVTPPAASAIGWTSTAPTSFTFSAQGARTAYAWAKDAAGNVSASKSASVTISLPDAVAPSVTAFAIPANGTSLTVTVSTFTATDNIAVTGYLVTESSTAPTAATAGWSGTAPASYAVTGNVPQGAATSVTLYGWAKDAAGNVSASSSATVTLTLPDTTKPVVVAFSIPATANTAAVNITTLTATDNLAVTGYLLTESATAPAASDSGWTSIPSTSYTFTGLPQGVATAKTLYAWAKDAAGNVSLSSSASVTITLTGPSLVFNPTVLANGTATKNPALNYAGTATGTGTVTLTITNNEQPVTFTFANGDFNAAILLISGENRLVATATDDNGTTTDTRVITLNTDLADLTVTSPANGSFTKNSLVDLVGTVGAPQSTTVTVKLNDEAEQTATLVGDTFIMQLNLVAGPNTIVVTATDTVSGAHTQTVGITSDGSAPDLAVTSPTLPFFTAKQSAVLTGTASDDITTPTVTVTVDGVALETQPVVTAGAFSATIALPTVKEYAVVVTVTDQSGNSSAVSGKITRKDPSGNATDGVSAPTIVDVQKALQFALGTATPTADELTNMDVAPLVSSKPAPDGVIDGGDALVILEKVVGTVTW